MNIKIVVQFHLSAGTNTSRLYLISFLSSDVEVDVIMFSNEKSFCLINCVNMVLPVGISFKKSESCCIFSSSVVVFPTSCWSNKLC